MSALHTLGVALLGSTGSIGDSTLDVIARHPERFQVIALTANSRVKKLLEQVTLTIWVPKLFLTTSQRLLDTLQVSEKQIQKNLEAIQGVVNMQEVVQTDVNELSQKLKSANKALATMTSSTSGLTTFTQNFSDAVSQLTTYQSEIHTLYQQMADNSNIFQENVKLSIKNSDSFRIQTNEIFGRQNEQLNEILTALRSYESAYIREREKIDLKMQSVLEAAEGTYIAMSERNREVLEGVSQPVTERLGKIDESLGAGLDAIDKRFGTFDGPIKKAAEQIEGSLETVVSRMESLTEELQRAFFKQNETINKNLTDLLKGIEAQSSNLSEGTKTQAEVSGIMKEKVTLLAENISSLNNAVEILNESSRAGQGVLTQMGQLGDFSKKIESLVVVLEKGNKTQESQTRNLLQELERNSKSQEKHTRELVKEIGIMGKNIDRQMKKNASAKRNNIMGSVSESISTEEMGANTDDRHQFDFQERKNKNPFRFLKRIILKVFRIE